MPSLVSIVERVVEPGMYWEDLWEALNEEGIEYSESAVKKIIARYDFKILKFYAHDFIRGIFQPGMSIETLAEITQLDTDKLYRAVRTLGHKRPKRRHRMTAAERVVDLMLLNVSVKE